MDCFLLGALRLSRGNKTDSFSTRSSYHTFCRVAYFGVLFTTLEEWIPSLVKSLMTWVIKLFVLQRLRSYWAKGDGKGLWALSLYWLLFDPHLTLHCCVYSAFVFHVLRNLRKKKEGKKPVLSNFAAVMSHVFQQHINWRVVAQQNKVTLQ